MGRSASRRAGTAATSGDRTTEMDRGRIRRGGRGPHADRQGDGRMVVRRSRRGLQGRRGRARRNLHRPVDRASSDGNAQRNGVLAERQAPSALLHPERRADRGRRGALGWDSAGGCHPGVRIHGRRIRQQGRRRRLDGHSRAALEEGQRAGDDAREPRRGKLLRACPHEHGRAPQGGLRKRRPHPRARPVHYPGQRSVRSDGRSPIGRQHRIAACINRRRCGGAR